MSTDLLTRRMDLIHTLDGSTKINHLTMDTSYPVKVKGIILKEYVATSTLDNYPYSDNNVVFDIKNQNGDVVAQFKKTQCFTLDGDQLDSLPLTGEYVMIIADLDENKIFVSPMNDIGGGSFKKFVRSIPEMESVERENDADPIIDLMSLNPVDYYTYSTAEGATNTKAQYPAKYYDDFIDPQHRLLDMILLHVKQLKTKKAHGALLAVAQKKCDDISVHDNNITDVDLYFDKAPGTYFRTAKIDPQPAMYASYLYPTDHYSYPCMAPVDTTAPGTIKMFEIDLDRDIDEVMNAEAGTAYNLLARAASIQNTNVMNYSFVRNSEDLILYQFYQYTPEETNITGMALAPVADVEIEDLNRLQSNMAVCTFACPVAESVGHLTRSYSTIESTMSIVQTIGNLSDSFKDLYGIDYSEDPASAYQQIMNREGSSNPLSRTPYPGGYFDYIKGLHEESQYYLTVASTNPPLANDYESQAIKFVPVKIDDNYISMTSQVGHSIMINGEPAEFNIEESDYAPYITTFWWSQGVDGSKNIGLDILTNPNNGNKYLAGSGRGLFGSNDDQIPELSYTFDPCDPTVAAPTSNEFHCTVLYKLDSEIIDEIIDAAQVPDSALEKAIFQLRAQYISREIDDIVYKLDDPDHGTTFESSIGVATYSGSGSHTTKIPVGVGSLYSNYKFEYEMSNNDAASYYINTAAEHGSSYYKIKKMRVEYPHMANFDTKDILWEYITVFILLKMYRAMYFEDGDTGNPRYNIVFRDDLGVNKAYVGTSILYSDSARTVEVTEADYTGYKNDGVDKTLYFVTGEEDSRHVDFYEGKLTIHFTPAPSGSSAIQQNDVYYIERLVEHHWTGSAWTTTTNGRNKYEIVGRNLNLFQYSVNQVVPSAVAFYQTTMPWPRAAKVGSTVWPPQPDTSYGIDFQRWFKTIECWKAFSNNETDALRKMHMYNRGIDDQFIYTDSSKTKYRNLYDFVYDLFTKDVGCRMDESSRKQSSTGGKLGFYRASVASNPSNWEEDQTTHELPKNAPTAKWAFNITSEHPHGSIDTYLTEISDTSIDYSVNQNNRINIARVTTGLKKVAALSLLDENGDKLLLTGTDVIPITADAINWKDLLNALSTNKRLDILEMLVGLKRFAKSDRQVQHPHRQNSVAYALSYDAEGNGSGIAIEGVDRFQMTRSFWEDPITDIAPAYWYINSGNKQVPMTVPVICPLEGTSFRSATDIYADFANGDKNPVRYETFYFEVYLSAPSGQSSRLFFKEIDPDGGLMSRLTDGMSPEVYIAGHPARIALDLDHNQFYVKEGFHNLFGKKYFHCIEAERNTEVDDVTTRRSSLATGFIRISGHHNSGSASKVSATYSHSDSDFSNDYVDGLYYSTVTEGLLRSTTRVLKYETAKTLLVGSSNDPTVMPIFNPSGTTYSNLYSDSTLTDGTQYTCVFDGRGRVTSITALPSDPSIS